MLTEASRHGDRPDATAKLYSRQARSQRVAGSPKCRPRDPGALCVLIDIRARDERDAGRTARPCADADADLLDTSDMDIDAAIAKAIEMVEARRG